ncbi:Fe-S protein assembly chaperone HscA [Rickettsiales bacterium LUAb2]
MKLLQIKDPKQIKENTEIEDDIAVGIDLGTTNSVVAVYNNDKVEVIANELGDKLLKSLIVINDNKIAVGEKAAIALNEQKHTVIKSIKRLMGKGINEISNNISDLNLNIDIKNSEQVIKIKADTDLILTPEQISAYILLELKNRAEKHLNKPISKAVITVPAYFNEAARLATKRAAEIAGLQVLRLINEPTSAALAYGLDDKLEGTYVIYDLGGGTFDVSILKLDKGVFRVLATSGDVNLGGDNIDNLIAQKIISFLEQKNITNLSNQESNYILLKAKQLKEILSSQENHSITLEIRGNTHSFVFNNYDLKDLINPIIDKTINICKHALQDANLSITDTKGIVLVGGSTRIPYLQNKLEEVFAIKPYSNLNPDEVVAIGAAYQAANLTGKIQKSLLLDVVPLSLGIETVGGITEKIIFRNSPTPIAKAQEFTTFKDNQTAMLIHVLQGEREMVKDNQSLAKFSLKGIPSMVAGAAKVEVTFMVDSDGLLFVTAQEKTTSVKQEIEIKPSFGLAEDEIKQMIIDGLQNAEQDMQQRILEVSKVDALTLINSSKSALKIDQNLLTSKEVDKINKFILQLEKLIEHGSREEIEDASKNLALETEKFAELRMNKSIQQALTGKSIKDVENN